MRLIMKATLALLCLALLLASAPVLAAPYGLDSPPESFTWGETQETVYNTLRNKLGHVNIDIMGTESLALPPADPECPIIVFTFYQDQLVSVRHIARIAPSIAEGEEQYNQLYQKLTRLYGTPANMPCLVWQDGCVAVEWQAAPDTIIGLSKTERYEKVGVNYFYASGSLYPLWQQTYKDFGPFMNMRHIAGMLASNDQSQNDFVFKQRIRIIGLRLKNVQPLVFERDGYRVVCQLQDKSQLAALSSTPRLRPY